MCVVNDGQREPAARSSCSTASARPAIVAPGTTSGVTAAMACSTVAIARPIASSSSSVLTRRSSLTRRDPVRSGSKPNTRPSSSTVSAQTRSPTATAPSRAEAARDALEDRRPVVGLVHDDHLAVRLLAQVERGEHPREDEDRLRVRVEERSADPAVRVRDLAEVRDLPLDAGQVLEVGGRREEERVDALLLHALCEAPPALGVIEHSGESKPRQDLAAEQVDAVRLVDAVRRAEVDARRSGFEQRLGLGGDLGRRPGEREARRARRPRAALPPPARRRLRRARGSARAARARSAPSDRARRPRRRTSRPRRAPARVRASVLVDHGHRADDDPDRRSIRAIRAAPAPAPGSRCRRP